MKIPVPKDMFGYLELKVTVDVLMFTESSRFTREFQAPDSNAEDKAYEPLEMSEHSHLCDMNIVTESGKKVPCHKLQLSRRYNFKTILTFYLVHCIEY